MPKARAVVIVQFDKKHYLMCTSDGFVTGFTTVGAGLHHFKGAYRRKHHLSYEGSMSAYIHSAHVQPSVIPIKDVKELEFLIDRDETGICAVSWLKTGTGFMHGLLLNEKAQAVWDGGKKPSLMA